MRFLHLIFRHPELKLIAFVLAVLLWFHVATNQTYDIDLHYSLHYVNLPDSLVLAVPPPVRTVVRLRGSGKTLLRVLWQDRRWPVDLSRVAAGPITARLHAEMVPRYGLAGLEVVELVGPADLPLLVDSLGHKTVPVESAVDFRPAPGFVRVGAAILTPDSVHLLGPRGMLAGIEMVRTRSTNYTDLKETQQITLQFVRPAGYNVAVDPAQTSVYQRIEPYVTRQITSLPVHVVAVAGLPSVAVPDRVAVELGGPQSAMGVATPESVTVRLMVGRDDTTGARLPLQVHVHPPLEVLKVIPDSVTLQRP